MKDFIKNKLNEELNLNNYNKWLKENAKNAKIIKSAFLNPPTSENFLNKQLAFKEIKKLIKPNECFHNAGKVFEILSKDGLFDVTYELGILIENGKKVGHAWNTLNGVNVDFTMEIFQPDLKNPHFNIVSLNNLNDIMNLSVFSTETCKFGKVINGEGYDANGLCSLYPYFLSITNQ